MGLKKREIKLTLNRENMTSGDKISMWWRELFRRRRLSLFNHRDNREVWYTHISPANIFMAIVSTITLTFVIVLALIVYTPLLGKLPWYRNKTLETHQYMVESIVRIDSMERVINNMMIYSENVSSIMAGKGAKVAELIDADTLSLDKSIVSSNSVDSILRAEMEGDGRYSILASSSWSDGGMIVPVEGDVVRRFDIAEGSYGVEIESMSDGRVIATQRGVVVLAHWSYDSNYVVAIMHPNQMISIYRGIKRLTARRGESVKAGEVVGYNSIDNGVEASSDATGLIVVGFEIWSNGKPIDPERYVMF